MGSNTLGDRIRVVFVCGDNLGRSQVAEALFNKYAKASSAQSCAGKPEVNELRRLSDVKRDAIVDIIGIMRDRYGIDIGSAVSKPFSWDMVRGADKVITLCAENECPNIPGAEHWDIPKLSLLDMEGKRRALLAIDEKVKALLAQVEG